MGARVRIRAAVEDDATAVSRLFAEMGHPTPDRVVRERITAFASSPIHQFVVAEVGGEVVGCITAHLLESPAHSRPYGEVSALSVTASHQRRGIGRRLLERVEQWAQAKGAFRVRVTSASHRTETAHRFYAAMRYRLTGVRFDKELTGARGGAARRRRSGEARGQ